MYSWLAFFVTGMVLFGYLAFFENRIRDWLLVTLCTFCAAYTHYYGLLAAIAAWGFLLVVLLIKNRKGLVYYRLCAMALFALYLPWFFFLMRQTSRVSQNFWIQPVTFIKVSQVVMYPFRYKFEEIPNAFSFPGFLLASISIAVGLVAALRTKERQGWVAAAGIIVYILTLFLAILISFLLQPILAARYMLACLGLFILAVSYGLFKIKRLAVVLSALALYVSISAPVLVDVYTKDFNGPAREAYEDLKDRVTPGDIFLHSNEHNMGTFSYYFPEQYHYLYIPPNYVPFSNYEVFSQKGDSGSDYLKFNKKPVTIWVTSLTDEPYSVPVKEIYKDENRIKIGGLRWYSKPGSWYRFGVQQVEYVADKFF